MSLLPSLFELGAFTREDSLVAVASRVVAALSGDVESWDLSLYGDGFQPLACDPFSFRGHFLDEGLLALEAHLLGPGGFVFPAAWQSNSAHSEYHATVY